MTRILLMGCIALLALAQQVNIAGPWIARVNMGVEVRIAFRFGSLPFRNPGHRHGCVCSTKRDIG